MKKFIQYFFLFTLMLVLQTSFLPVLFSHNPAPQLILLSAVALSLVAGFHKALLPIIAAGLAYDIAFSPVPGLNTAIFVFAAYLAGFLSRRFLVENKTGGLLSMASMAVLAIAFNRFYILLADKFFLEDKGQLFFSAAFFRGLPSEIIASLAVFFALVLIFQKIEKIPLIVPMK